MAGPYIKRRDDTALLDDGWIIIDSDAKIIAHLDTEMMTDGLLDVLTGAYTTTRVYPENVPIQCVAKVFKSYVHHLEFDWPDSEDKRYDWPVYSVYLKGWGRYQHSPIHKEPFPEVARKLQEQLIKWVKAPTEAIVAKWIADNDMTGFIEDSIDSVGCHSAKPEDSLDLMLNENGDIIGGNPDSVNVWKKVATTFGDALHAAGIEPIYMCDNVCEPCSNYRWSVVVVGGVAASRGKKCPLCNKFRGGIVTEEYGFVTSGR